MSDRVTAALIAVWTASVVIIAMSVVSIALSL